MTLRDEANALSLGAGACAGYALWWLTHKRLIPQEKMGTASSNVVPIFRF